MSTDGAGLRLHALCSLDSVVELRHRLHQHPELSGSESSTAATIVAALAPLRPDSVVTGLGGHSVAVVFHSGARVADGPTVMFRCELDALPIVEANDCSHRSCTAGVSHKCGHDGHMAILVALASALAVRRPTTGRVVLLFQEAEETGQGAAAVLADPKFAALSPDYSFALHNVPGHPLGQVRITSGSFSCASRGLVVEFEGTTSHAAHPEDGRSPAAALCGAIAALTALSHTRAAEHSGGARGAAPFRLVTVVHARLGEVAFGTAPGDAVVMATLRTETDGDMHALVRDAQSVCSQLAAADGLAVRFRFEDVFPAGENNSDAAGYVRRAAAAVAAAMPGARPSDAESGGGVAGSHKRAKTEGSQAGGGGGEAAAAVTLEEMSGPYRWSEDFGAFRQCSKNAMFALGAGLACPQLHTPLYDFPDALLPLGASLFWEIACMLTDAQ